MDSGVLADSEGPVRIPLKQFFRNFILFFIFIFLFAFFTLFFTSVVHIASNIM